MVKIKMPLINTEKVVNKLIKNNVVLNLKKTENDVVFYVKLIHFKSTINILKKSGIENFSYEFKGFSNIFLSLKRVGIITAIIISFAIYLISNLFVTKIQINGNFLTETNDIIKILNENGVKTSSLKSSINTKLLENKLMEISYISSVSVVTKGTTLIVNVKEKLNNSEYVNLGKFEPVISLYDAKIVSMNVVQGSPSVKVGDIVKLGDVLVEPFVISSDGKILEVQPIAEIVCEIWFSSTLCVKDVSVQSVRTGNVIENRKLTLCGLDIFSENKQNNFNEFEVETEEANLTNMFLPLKVIKQKIYEIEKKDIVVDFENEKQKFVEQCRKMSLLNIQNDDKIKDESYVCEKTQEGNLISYTITVVRKVL